MNFWPPGQMRKLRFNSSIVRMARFLGTWLLRNSSSPPKILESRIDWFAFERQHAEDALVHFAKRLFLDESL